MNFLIAIIALMALFFNIQAQNSLHFGIISDIQYCDCDAAGSRLYRGVPQKLRSAIDSLENNNIDFLLNLGDVINKYWASFDTIMPILDSASFTVYNILGNHDFEELSQLQRDSLTIRLNMPARYYTFKKGNWRFVMLDANELSSYAYPEGSNEYKVFSNYILNVDGPNSQVWNGGLLENQISWLRNILSEADTLGEQVIVAGHPNIYPLNMNSMIDYEKIAAILEGHNSVKLYVAGHWHSGAYVLNNDLHYLTVKALLDYPDSTAYSVVDITVLDVNRTGFFLIIQII